MKNRRNRKRGRAVCGARCALTLTAVFLLGLLPGFLMMEQAAQAEEPAAAAAAVFEEVEIRDETGGASEPAAKPAPALYGGDGRGSIRSTDASSRPADALADSQTALLFEYFDRYAAALGALEETSLLDLFDESDPSAKESAWIDQTALTYLIELRRMSGRDLSFSDYDYGLTFEAVERSGDGLRVVLLEDQRTRFASLGEIDSFTAGIGHVFVLRETGDGWKIAAHQRFEDLQEQIEEGFSRHAGGNPEEVSKLVLDELLADAKENIAARETAYAEYRARRGNLLSTDRTWDCDYDRAAAVAYARAWTDPVRAARNPDFGRYDQYGGNCNNFTSQCLLAGGIPMDHEGDAQWKWYGEEVNVRESASGRSPSWAGVDEFYEYCLQNEGFGLVSEATDNIYLAQPGDILQFGSLGEWEYSVIVTGILADENGFTADLLIHSNTADRMDYPASAYSYSEMRLIRIFGWNEG